MTETEEMRRRVFAAEKAAWDALGAAHADQIRQAERELAGAVRTTPLTWVVLDDDPTGVQTVHDLPVFTDWSEETLRGALAEPGNMFYILTNSRALSDAETTVLHRDLMHHLCQALESSDENAGQQKQPADPDTLSGKLRSSAGLQVISRSDSTLRGHFPLEVDLVEEGLRTELGMETDTVILAPFFEAGGRFTIHGIHYVRQNNASGEQELVPAALTEFAKDQTFGYRHSYLPAYVEEKTGGRIKADAVRIVPLELLRSGDVDAVERILREKPAMVAVDALAPADLRVFCAALYRRIRQGQRFVYRTAADFVRAAGGIEDRSLLTARDLFPARSGPSAASAGAKERGQSVLPEDAGNCAQCEAAGGVIVVGSHTEKTTRQLEALRGLPGLDFIPFHSELVLSGGLAGEADRVRGLVERDIAQGKTAVFYTGRKVLEVPGDTGEKALARSTAISDALVSVIGGLRETPRFILAKGGITSSDVGTKALGVRRAWVPGQIMPGIPVWLCGQESRFPGVPYIIFPGNVGEDDTLRRIVEKLTAK
ncbi:MAG: hydroxyacid dehydrogenase [Lachnospiraceae bacterium]|nr:hydroxyacid dehydrogenase [Lachnospiraceae bacterium]